MCLLYKVIHLFQRALFYATYSIFRVLKSKRQLDANWVIGVDEVADLLGEISRVIPCSVSVCFLLNPYYRNHYDYHIGVRQRTFNSAIRLIFGPILLGYLVNRHNRFFYIGKCGYLIHQFDGRSWEFSFLRKRGALIACYFAGSDIRSTAKMDEIAKELNRDVLTTYQRISHPGIDTLSAEKNKQALAVAADRYASLVFSFPVDQASYLTSECEPFLYFCREEKFESSAAKFVDLKEIKILHAPTSPLLKGTPLVRAAITRLREEGYPIQYLELQDVSNEEVMRELRSTHVVLNQFYAFVPGGFGIEALASHTVMLCSADRDIESALPLGANRAWIVTPSWLIYDRLKAVLDEPEAMREQAERGYLWALENCSSEVSAKTLNGALNSLSVH